MFADIVLPIYADHLLTTLDRPARSVFCHVDQTIPPVYAHPLQIHLWPGAVAGESTGDWELGGDCSLSFSIGITSRCGNVPEDRMFSLLYGADGGLMPLVRRVWSVLGRDRYQLQTTINEAMPDGWKMIEWPNFASKVITAQRVGPDHFHADPEAADVRKDFGVLVVLEWTGARFVNSWVSDGNPDPGSTPPADWQVAI